MGSNEVVRLAREIEAYARAMFPPGVDVHTTGNLVVVSSISEGVLIGQVQSIGIAFCVIFIVLAIMFLSTRWALRDDLTLPVVIFFGVMGWARRTRPASSRPSPHRCRRHDHCMARLNR
jgi:predicted RND superfamily exporter protein